MPRRVKITKQGDKVIIFKSANFFTFTAEVIPNTLDVFSKKAGTRGLKYYHIRKLPISHPIAASH